MRKELTIQNTKRAIEAEYDPEIPEELLQDIATIVAGTNDHENVGLDVLQSTENKTTLDLSFHENGIIYGERYCKDIRNWVIRDFEDISCSYQEANLEWFRIYLKY